MSLVEHFFSDPEVMAEGMSVVAPRVSVRPLRRGRFSSSVQAVTVGDLALFRVRSTALRATIPSGNRFLSFNLPLGASCEAAFHGHTYAIDDEQGWVMNPGEPFDFRAPDASDVLVVHVFEPLLSGYSTMVQDSRPAWTGGNPQPLTLNTASGRASARYVRFLWGEARRGSPLLNSRIASEELAKAFLTSLSLSASDAEPRGTIKSLHVRRATEFIEACLDDALSQGDVARAAGIHPRTLQRAFRAHYGNSVMGFVRERRLERVQTQLLDSDPAITTVTEVALANGFFHLGRFSMAYRNRFGEPPSHTLRR